MHDKEIAKILNELADAYEIINEPFRAIPFRKAAKFLEQGIPVAKKVGIGKATIDEINFIKKYGYSKRLERIENAKLYKQYKAFTKILGVGHALAKEMIDAGLRTLADARKWPRLPEQSKFGLKYYEDLQMRTPRTVAKKFIEQKIVPCIGKGIKFMPLGSYRRCKETIGDLDIIIFLDGNPVDDVRSRLERCISIYTIRSGDQAMSCIAKLPAQMVPRVIRCDFFFCHHGLCPEYINYATGSKEHNVMLRAIAKKKGFKLNQYGLYDGDKKIEVRDEHHLYELLGKEYISPEKR